MLVVATFTTTSADAKGKIEKGASLKTKMALKRAADKAAKIDAAKRQRSQAMAVKKAESRIAGDMAKLRKSLERQPGYADYKKEFDRLTSMKTRGAKQERSRRAALLNLQRKHGKMMTASFKDSGISSKKIASQLVSSIVGRLFSCIDFDFDPFGGFSVDWSDCFDTPDDNSSNNDPEPTNICLTAPYSEWSTSNNQNLTAFLFDEMANDNTGEVSLDSLALLAGQGNNRAVVGDYVTIPAGFSRVKVTVKYRMSYYVSSLGIYGGVGTSSANLRMELTGLNNQSSIRETTIGSSTSAVMWMNFNELENEPYTMQETFNINSSGGQFLIRAGISSNCLAVVGGGSAYMDGNVEEICIEALP
jgi:hypothetical protein